jgi:hypothetical protein
MITNETNKKFIAYFDYLGFKQFIENNDLEYQKQIMGNVYRDIESALGQGKLKQTSPSTVIADLTNHKINCINFSDTVVFWTKDDSLESLTEILKVTHHFNRRTTLNFFPARGSLVYGEIVYVDYKQLNEVGGLYNINSVFGKGLVEAHQKAEFQQWSGAVIDETVIQFLDSKKIDVSSYLAPYAKLHKVPYKNGVEIEEYAFKLFEDSGISKDGFDNFSKHIKGNFANYKKSIEGTDVQAKIENTIKYLETFKE